MQGDEIGFYFEVEPGLKVAIEKDLECVDGPRPKKILTDLPRTAKNLLAQGRPISRCCSFTVKPAFFRRL